MTVIYIILGIIAYLIIGSIVHGLCVRLLDWENDLNIDTTLWPLLLLLFTVGSLVWVLWTYILEPISLFVAGIGRRTGG